MSVALPNAMPPPWMWKMHGATAVVPLGRLMYSVMSFPSSPLIVVVSFVTASAHRRDPGQRVEDVDEDTSSALCDVGDPVRQW